MNKVLSDLIWSDLIWSDLTWPDLTWPDLTWPYLTLPYLTLSYLILCIGRQTFGLIESGQWPDWVLALSHWIPMSYEWIGPHSTVHQSVQNKPWYLLPHVFIEYAMMINRGSPCFQINFNEAIARAVQEKDRLIEEMRAQLDKIASTSECLLKSDVCCCYTYNFTSC